MKARKILAKAISSPANIRFGEMQRLAEAFGFQLIRVSASHHIYGRPDLAEQVNFRKWAARQNRIRFDNF
jgi:hypothetical protein